MLEYLIANGVLGASAIVAALIVCHKKKEVPCDSCEYLVCKREHPRHLESKYQCSHDRMWVHRTFDKAPTYCKYYEPRKEDKR